MDERLSEILPREISARPKKKNLLWADGLLLGIHEDDEDVRSPVCAAGFAFAEEPEEEEGGGAAWAASKTFHFSPSLHAFLSLF